jgi:hypothetical protein
MKKIVIGTSALLITFRCNLRCKLCCTNTPYWEKSRQADFPLDELKAVVSRYYAVVSYIRKFSLGGGEPMLHAELPELIEYIMNFKEQFEVLEIITNGVVVPDGGVIGALERYKDSVFITIDNYGAQLSRAVSASAEAYEQRGIKHQIRNYNAEEAHCGGWVDLGDFSHKHGAEESKAYFARCVTANKKKNNTVTLGDSAAENDGDVFFINYAANTNGKVHHCARAYSTLVTGAINDTPENFVNTLDCGKSIEQIQQEIIAMWSAAYYEPCEYCNGFDDRSVRFIPAEQL